MFAAFFLAKHKEREREREREWLSKREREREREREWLSKREIVEWFEFAAMVWGQFLRKVANATRCLPERQGCAKFLAKTIFIVENKNGFL